MADTSGANQSTDWIALLVTAGFALIVGIILENYRSRTARKGEKEGKLWEQRNKVYQEIYSLMLDMDKDIAAIAYKCEKTRPDYDHSTDKFLKIHKEPDELKNDINTISTKLSYKIHIFANIVTNNSIILLPDTHNLLESHSSFLSAFAMSLRVAPITSGNAATFLREQTLNKPEEFKALYFKDLNIKAPAKRKRIAGWIGWPWFKKSPE